MDLSAIFNTDRGGQALYRVKIWWPFAYQIWKRGSPDNNFRDNGHSVYLGHDLNFSRSCDVIGHVTNRSAICHFLLVSHCDRTSISNRFRDIRPPISVRTHRHMHTQTHRNTPQVILYSVPCNVLHWTDNKWASELKLDWPKSNDTTLRLHLNGIEQRYLKQRKQVKQVAVCKK